MPLPHLTCQHCSHSWIPRKDAPTRCPKCKERLAHVVRRHRVNVAYRPDQEGKVRALRPRLDEIVQKAIDEAI